LSSNTNSDESCVHGAFFAKVPWTSVMTMSARIEDQS
jgi:hypothetical protein